MTPGTFSHAASPARRIAAFLIDGLVLGAYAALLTFVSIKSGFSEEVASDTWAARAGLHLVGFVTLTLPVLLYFSLLEGSSTGTTLGKRLCGIRVTNTAGMPAGLRRGFARNIIRFLPWEMAHAGI